MKPCKTPYVIHSLFGPIPIWTQAPGIRLLLLFVSIAMGLGLAIMFDMMFGTNWSLLADVYSVEVKLALLVAIPIGAGIGVCVFSTIWIFQFLLKRRCGIR